MGIVRTDDRYYAEIAEAIRSKNGKSTEYYPSEMAAAIEALEGEPIEGNVELYEITVTPTGKTFTEYAEDGTGFSEVTVKGDANLTPQNIANGVVIYGVTGNLVAGASIKVPVEYRSYVDHALTMYTEEYEDLAILESDSHLVVMFIMSDFAVTTYNSSTTEYGARGWLSCSLDKETNKWAITDHRNSATTGGSAVSNVRFSTKTWKYNGEVIWPTSGGGGENLSAELAAQSEIIDQMVAALDGKCGIGGGSNLGSVANTGFNSSFIVTSTGFLT